MIISSVVASFKYVPEEQIILKPPSFVDWKAIHLCINPK